MEQGDCVYECGMFCIFGSQNHEVVVRL